MMKKALSYIHHLTCTILFLMLPVLLSGCLWTFPRVSIVPNHHVYINRTPDCVWARLGTAVAAPPGFSESRYSFWLALAVDSNGIIYLTYLDENHDDHLTVMKYEGNSWVAVGHPGFSAGRALFPILALDKAGTPRVSYTEQNADNSYYVFTIMEYVEDAWVPMALRGVSLEPVRHVSLAFDASGESYITYMDRRTGYGKLEVSTLTEGGLSAVGPPAFSSTRGRLTALALDGTGSPYVIYGENFSKTLTGKQRLSVIKLESGIWSTLGSLDASTCSDCPPALAVDAAGTAYVAYTDKDNGLRLTVKKFAGGEWVTVGSPGFTTTEAGFAALSFSPNGIPYVAYMRLAGDCGYVFDVKRFVGDSWLDMDFPGTAAETNTSSLPAK